MQNCSEKLGEMHQAERMPSRPALLTTVCRRISLTRIKLPEKNTRAERVACEYLPVDNDLALGFAAFRGMRPFDVTVDPRKLRIPLGVREDTFRTRSLSDNINQWVECFVTRNSWHSG